MNDGEVVFDCWEKASAVNVAMVNGNIVRIRDYGGCGDDLPIIS